jgi:hypothetical protein
LKLIVYISNIVLRHIIIFLFKLNLVLNPSRRLVAQLKLGLFSFTEPV